MYAYAEKHGISKQQVKEIYKRRTENLSTTQMTKNVKGEVAYDDPLLPNGLVYPVKQTNDMEADAFLPKGYKVSLQDQTLGEALLRGFGKGVDKLLCATIGPCYQAHASYGRLAMEIAKNGPAMVNMADKSWKWTAVTLGLGAKTLYEKHLLKQEHYDAVDFIEKRILLSPTSDFDTNIRILETFGKGVFDNKIALGHAGKLFNEAKEPTEEDKNLEIVDAVGGQHIDPDHEPGDHKKDKGETLLQNF